MKFENEYFNVEVIEVDGKKILKSIKTNIGGNKIDIIAKHQRLVPTDEINMALPMFEKGTYQYDIAFDIWVNGILAADDEILREYLFFFDGGEFSIHRVIGLLNSIYTDLKLRLLKKHPQSSQEQDSISMAVLALEKTGKINDPKSKTSSYALTTNGLQYKRSIQYFNGKILYKTRWFIDVPVDDKVLDQYGVTSDISITQEPVSDVDIMPNEIAEKLIEQLKNK